MANDYVEFRDILAWNVSLGGHLQIQKSDNEVNCYIMAFLKQRSDEQTKSAHPICSIYVGCRMCARVGATPTLQPYRAKNGCKKNIFLHPFTLKCPVTVSAPL